LGYFANLEIGQSEHAGDDGDLACDKFEGTRGSFGLMVNAFAATLLVRRLLLSR